VKRHLSIAAAAVVALATLAGCVDPPPTKAPEVVPVPAQVGGESALSTLFRSVRAYTVRIRTTQCDEVVTGTGWAYDKRTIITNRHVVETGSRIEVETWDGDSLAVASVQQATGPDLAIIHLAQDAPAVAPRIATKDPKVGTRVHAIGYALGKAQHMNNGVVVKYTKNSDIDPYASVDRSGTVMQMSGNIEPGNSGSPIVDDHGTVVAIVFEYELRTGWDTAQPVSRLRPLLKGNGLAPVVPC
jgi:S1-C subfamily serine protease